MPAGDWNRQNPRNIDGNTGICWTKSTLNALHRMRAKNKRDRTKRSKARNLLERLMEFETETLRFMDDELVPFINNSEYPVSIKNKGVRKVDFTEMEIS